MKFNDVKSTVPASFRKCYLGFRQKRLRRYKISVWPTASPVYTMYVVTQYLPQRCQQHRHYISRHDVTAARTELLNSQLFEEVRHVLTLTSDLEYKSGILDVTRIFFVCNPIGTGQS